MKRLEFIKTLFVAPVLGFLGLRLLPSKGKTELLEGGIINKESDYTFSISKGSGYINGQFVEWDDVVLSTKHEARSIGNKEHVYTFSVLKGDFARCITK